MGGGTVVRPFTALTWGRGSVAPILPNREMGTGLLVLTIGEYRYVHLGLIDDPSVTRIKTKYDSKYVIFKVTDDQEVGLNMHAYIYAYIHG